MGRYEGRGWECKNMRNVRKSKEVKGGKRGKGARKEGCGIEGGSNGEKGDRTEWGRKERVVQ
jgi:hypothetical protein